MKKINKHLLYDPFWAQNAGFKGGRDPLGIENSSITVYEILLPGLSNLTGHVRYYSLYCWLIYKYDELITNDSKCMPQYDFIRRAELALAYIMNAYPDVVSVVGRDFATKHRNDEEYDLSKGADYKSGAEEKYWTYWFGALGQYYVGSMIYLKLLAVDQHTYHITSKGKELAIAFANSIDKGIQKRYLSIINNGILHKKDIDTLTPFCVNKIRQGTAEWKFLVNMFMSNDVDSSTRVDSVNILLHILKNENKISLKLLPRIMYSEHGGYNETSYGWYYYFLCECLHFSVESIFWMFLKEAELATNSIYVLFKQNCIKKLFLSLDKYQNKSLNYCLKNINDSNSLLFYRDKMVEYYMANNHIKTAKYGILTLLSLSNISLRDNDNLNAFENKYFLKEQNGSFIPYCERIFNRPIHDDLTNFIEATLNFVLDEHIKSSLRKMGSDNANLLKFLVEDGRLIHVQTLPPKFTNPRLGSLFNLLTDLGLIS